MGNWAERRGLAYTGYTDLAAQPAVYELIRDCIEQVNRDLAADPRLAGSQVHRFLLLHKELDADDGELTRTRKVRRRFVAERYADLIAALYGNHARGVIETQVRFEDGRSGWLRADLAIELPVPLPWRWLHESAPSNRRRHPRSQPHLAALRWRQGADRHQP